jgi:hypothetical protein
MEKWKPIPSLPSYIACDDGRVMALPFTGVMPNGGVKHYGGSPSFGILVEGRYKIFYKGKNYKVHRLICEAFNGPAPEKAVCMHLNEDATDNRSVNLQWGTQKQNLAAPGFRAYCKRRGWSATKINEAQAKSIKYGGKTCKALALEFGISPATVSNIRAGRSWKHI